MKKALIVDDDPIIRNLVSTLLRRRNFAVAQAANGDEAILLLRASVDSGGVSEYDLVVLDLMMPKVSGWDVIRFIVDEVPGLAPHVIVVSATGEPALTQLRELALGALIGKPFDTNDFYAAIDGCTRGVAQNEPELEIRKPEAEL